MTIIILYFIIVLQGKKRWPRLRPTQRTMGLGYGTVFQLQSDSMVLINQTQFISH